MADPKTDPYADDAERQRERLASTIDDIQDRLSPRAILSDAADAVQERGAALARAAGDHKLALGLIGGAVGLLLLAKRTGIEATETWATARDKTADLANAAKIKANEATNFANENFNTNPLLGAILGIAAGAFAGALLPRTETEDALVGEHRDRFTDAAKDAIKAAVDAGREQLDGYGLNPETAREKLGELTNHVNDLSRTIAQAAADSFRNGRPN